MSVEINEPKPVVSRFGRKYAWKRDIPDQRDMMFSAPLHAALPSKVDLSSKCEPIEDQGVLGSCVSHAIGTCLEFVTTKSAKDLSRLFIYYNCRVLEHDVTQDNGTTIRTGAKVCTKYGSAIETLWPYDIKKFTIKPPVTAYQDAPKQKASQYMALNGLLPMKTCLVQGFPFAIGISVYESFETEKVASTGIIPMPKSNEQMLGGHAICAVGYNDTKNAFYCRNSWGIRWGIKGHFWIPYAYLTNTSLAGDAWTLR